MKLLNVICSLAAITCAAASVAHDLILPPYATFAIAGLSGMTAWLVIHPGDVVKTRMQLAEKKKDDAEPAKNALAVAKDMIREEGAGSLYGGLSAAMARQATYTTLRLGLYDIGKKLALDVADRRGLGGLVKFGLRQLVGAVSGAIASFLSCPVEVCLVRMQADGKLPPNKRRNYKNIVDALLRIGREEGVTAYWTGASTTVIRAMVVSVTQIAAYDQTKASLEGKLDGLALHAASGVAAAFIFCTASMPFDTVKTRKQQAVKASAGQLSSAAAADSTFGAIARVRREEGLAALWNGYPPYLASKGLLTVLLFIIKEKYTVWALQAVGLPAPVSEFVTKH